MIAVVVAAGAGRRLGTVAKALLPTAEGGPTFLAAIAATARACGVEQLVVVVGPPFADEVAEHAASLRSDVVVNPRPDRGMASSIELGFARAAELDPGGPALLWPVDHPFVSAVVVSQVCAALGDNDAVIPVYAGRGGHPVVVHRRLWPALATCSELEVGARSVFRDPARSIVRLPVSGPEVVRDVDLPNQLPVGGGE